MKIRQDIKQKIEEALQGVGEATDISFSVETPDNQDHGDYATNIALLVAKAIGKNPLEIADEIARNLQDERWEVSVAPPGFLNFRIADAHLQKSIEYVLEQDDAWGTSAAGAGKTVMVEYFQLNIAKRPHIGHLRSAAIGDALKRMFLSQGYHAVSDTHVGDWGTQFGILLHAYKDQGDAALQEKIAGDPFEFLEDLYKRENKRIEENPERRERAKQEFAKLERGDVENRKIWQWMVEVSMQKLTESAEQLGLLPFDEHKGESSYEEVMLPIVEEALKRGVAEKKSDSAVVVDLTAEKLDEAVLIKSDGATTYLLRDLAAINYRNERWNFWKNLYVVDVRQAHHFHQLFRVAELLGFDGAQGSQQVEFGFMTLPEGAMSTRKGTAVALYQLLQDAERKAREIIREKNPALADADAAARKVGVGAIKYFDLSHNRKSDIVFDWDKALSFEGNTGPYVQYTYARLKSILRKNCLSGLPLAGISAYGGIRFEDSERRLAATILRYPEIIAEALSLLSPHVVAAYLYQLASTANEFYHAFSVLQEPDEAKRALRLVLVSTTALTLKNGMYLLGLEALEKM